jgi:mono/diheme cytochrome c family protein
VSLYHNQKDLRGYSWRQRLANNPVRVGLLLGIMGVALACQSLPDVYPYRAESEHLESSARDAIRGRMAQRFGQPVKPLVPELLGLELTRVVAGQQRFKSLCAKCHGVLGNGDGRWLDARRGARDLTRGAFKFTSTGASPTRSDLKRTIRRGVPGTRMPAFPEEDAAQIEAMVDYIQFIAIRGSLERSLIAQWDDEEELLAESVSEDLAAVVKSWTSAKDLVIVPDSDNPPITAATLARGRELFLSNRTKCFDCHGADATGDGPGAADLKDDWGNDAEPRDLTVAEHGGGSRPIDLYRRIYGGIPGTPMPAMKNVLSSDEIWALVHYLKGL